jgi:acetylornithine deacetylase/succinyl-diaminopimelate desuccinylase-like protein
LLFRGTEWYSIDAQGGRRVRPRRFGPSRRLADARAELEEIGRRVAAETGARIEVAMTGVDAFEVGQDEPIVQVVRRAHETVTGRELPFAGTRTVANVPQFTHVARIPAVYYGATYLTAHSDVERVELAQLVRAARVYVHAILDYAGVAEEGR